jgi:hypothetical protein
VRLTNYRGYKIIYGDDGRYHVYAPQGSYYYGAVNSLEKAIAFVDRQLGGAPVTFSPSELKHLKYIRHLYRTGRITPNPGFRQASNPGFGQTKVYRGYLIVKVPSWKSPSGAGYNVHSYKGDFLAGQFGRQSEAKGYIDRLWRDWEQKKNPRGRRRGRGRRTGSRSRGELGLRLVRMGIVP